MVRAGVVFCLLDLTADAASNTTKFIQLLSENLILNSTANATEVMYYASEIVGAVLKEENRKVWVGRKGGGKPLWLECTTCVT